jgi:tetratricopeptide (TPR) repeat protein
MTHGTVLYALNQYELAEPLLKATVDIFDANQEDFFSTDNDGFYVVYSLLSDIYFALEREFAKDFALKVKKVFNKMKKEYIGKYCNMIFELAEYESKKQNYNEALMYYEECILWFEQYASNDLFLEKANIVRNYANILIMLYNTPEKARLLLEEALVIYKKYLPEETINYAQICNILGTLFIEREDFEHAEELYLSALEITKDKYVDHPVHRNMLGSLGLLYCNLHNHEKAQSFFSDAKYLYEKNHDTNYDYYARLMANYAILLHSQGENLKAKYIIETAKNLLLKSENSFTRDDWLVAIFNS